MKWRAYIRALPLALAGIALAGIALAAAATPPAAPGTVRAAPGTAPAALEPATDAQAAARAAVDAHGQLQDPALQGRFEQITKELRCLVCQNESIADSNAELAGDLRQQVQELLVAGKSDDAIFDFMTQRYGEFVRFSPPLTAKSLFIWGAPFLMLLLGGVIIYRVARARGAMPLDDEIAAGTDLK
jgi:cytochrome c-type biogenesis protein CcmH